MAKRQEVFLQGKLKWARTTTPDKYGNWKVTLYPDNPSYEKIMKLKEEGLLNVIGKDEDGYNVTFRRTQTKTTRAGKTLSFTPPEVLNSDGTLLKDTLIGNGSDGTVKLEVYPYNKPAGGTGIAARFEAIRIDNLIPYTTKDLGEEEQKSIKGLAEQPKPLF